MNGKLSLLPNIGSELERKLETAGIDSPELLKKLGSEQAFIKIRTIDETACLSMLYALEGAVQGMRWHSLDKLRKTELKEFFSSLGN